MISCRKGLSKKEIKLINESNDLKINILNFGIDLKDIINPFIFKIDCSNNIIPQKLKGDILFITYSSGDIKSKAEILKNIIELKNNNQVVIGIDINNKEDSDYGIFHSYLNDTNLRIIIEGIIDTIIKPTFVSNDGDYVIDFFINGGKFNFYSISAIGENKGPDIIHKFNNSCNEYEKIFLNFYSKHSELSMMALDYLGDSVEEKGNSESQYAVMNTYNENLKDEYFVTILIK